MRIFKLKNNGVTLIELLIVLVISVIVLMAAGVMSSTALSSHEKYRKQSQVYSDIMFGFELIQNSIHNVRGTVTMIPAPASWKDWDNSNPILCIDKNCDGVCNKDTVDATSDIAVGLQKPTGSQTMNFVFADYANNPDEKIILSNISQCTLTFTDDHPSDEELNGPLVIRIRGTKDKESFDMSTTVSRRN